MRRIHQRADMMMKTVLGLLLGFLTATLVVMMALTFGYMG